MSDIEEYALVPKKTTKPKPTSKVNASHAREVRLAKIQQRKEEEIDQMIKARQNKSNKTIIPDDSDSSDSDEDVVVYKPKVTKGRGKFREFDAKGGKQQSAQPTDSEEVLKQLKILQDMMSTRTPEPPKATQNEQLLNDCRRKILNF
jgi:uncharacterized membrane protein YqiK